MNTEALRLLADYALADDACGSAHTDDALRAALEDARAALVWRPLPSSQEDVNEPRGAMRTVIPAAAMPADTAAAGHAAHITWSWSIGADGLHTNTTAQWSCEHDDACPRGSLAPNLAPRAAEHTALLAKTVIGDPYTQRGFAEAFAHGLAGSVMRLRADVAPRAAADDAARAASWEDTNQPPLPSPLWEPLETAARIVESMNIVHGDAHGTPVFTAEMIHAMFGGTRMFGAMPLNYVAQ